MARFLISLIIASALVTGLLSVMAKQKKSFAAKNNIRVSDTRLEEKAEAPKESEKEKAP
jgi:hypothetical protein